MAGKRRVDLELRSRLAKWLRYYKDEAGGMTEQQFADLLGISQATLNENLNEKKTMSIETLYVMFKRLGANPTLMFRYTPEEAGFAVQAPTRHGKKRGGSVGA